MSESKSLTTIREELVKYIDQHPTLPDFVKEETKQLVVNHFNNIGKIIALAELTHHRTLQHDSV